MFCSFECLELLFGRRLSSLEKKAFKKGIKTIRTMYRKERGFISALKLTGNKVLQGFFSYLSDCPETEAFYALMHRNPKWRATKLKRRWKCFVRDCRLNGPYFLEMYI